MNRNLWSGMCTACFLSFAFNTPSMKSRGCFSRRSSKKNYHFYTNVLNKESPILFISCFSNVYVHVQCELEWIYFEGRPNWLWWLSNSWSCLYHHFHFNLRMYFFPIGIVHGEFNGKDNDSRGRTLFSHSPPGRKKIANQVMSEEVCMIRREKYSRYVRSVHTIAWTKTTSSQVCWLKKCLACF